MIESCIANLLNFTSDFSVCCNSLAVTFFLNSHSYKYWKSWKTYCLLPEYSHMGLYLLSHAKDSYACMSGSGWICSILCWEKLNGLETSLYPQWMNIWPTPLYQWPWDQLCFQLFILLGLYYQRRLFVVPSTNFFLNLWALVGVFIMISTPLRYYESSVSLFYDQSSVLG